MAQQVDIIDRSDGTVDIMGMPVELLAELRRTLYVRQMASPGEDPAIEGLLEDIQEALDKVVWNWR